VAIAARTAAALSRLLRVLAGLRARAIDRPSYLSDSGDEGGNTLAPLRLLYSRGDPGTFLHPSLFYDVTAAAYAAVYGALHVSGRIDGDLSIADLLVLDERYFVFTARAVSLLSAVVAMIALWALGRRLWNGLSGLAAAALLAVLPLHAMYSQTARVDSLFVAVFLLALLAILRALQGGSRAVADTAAVLTGLTVAANYNGAILVPWLFAALWMQPADGRRALGRAALLMVAAFLVACPFVVLNAPAFLQHLRFISGLSTAANPGMEGRDVLFYVTDLAHALPVLAAAIAIAGIAVLLVGNRAEGFVLSLAVAYLAVFSLVETKFDRFILPAMALFLLLVAGLPTLLTRRLGAHPTARAIAAAAAVGLVIACLATLAPRAMPVPRHEMLARSDALVLDWIDSHAPPRSTILVESGVVPLLDGLAEPGALGRALRESLGRVRPGLDQDFLFASYVGGVINYGPSLLADRDVAFAVISQRNLQYILRQQCDAFPDVCALYQQLRERARVAYVTPPGTEPIVIYDRRAAPAPPAS